MQINLSFSYLLMGIGLVIYCYSLFKVYKAKKYRSNSDIKPRKEYLSKNDKKLLLIATCCVFLGALIFVGTAIFSN